MSQVVRIHQATNYGFVYIPTYYNSSSQDLECGGPGYTEHGNVILGTPSLPDAGSDLLYFSSQPEASADRGIVCLRRSFIFSISTGCSAHLTPSTPTTGNCAAAAPDTKSQANEVQIAEAGFSAAYFGSGSDRVYLLGDLNARSNRCALNGLYSGFHEDPSGRSSKRATISTNCASTSIHGIDYAFAAKFGNGTSDGWGRSWQSSDHCLLLASFQ